MYTKHSWKQHLRNGNSRFAVAMVVALSATLLAFEWTTYDDHRIQVIGIDLPLDDFEIVYPPVVPLERKQAEAPPIKKIRPSDTFVPVDDIIEPKGPSVEPVKATETGTTDDPPLDIDPDTMLSDEIGELPEEPILHVEIMPYFKKCFTDDEAARQVCTKDRIHQHLKRYLTVPPSVREDVRTTVTFVIEKDGKVGRIHCAPRVDKSVQQEIERVMELIPLMQPGTQQGHAVPVYYQIPISVKIIG